MYKEKEMLVQEALSPCELELLVTLDKGYCFKQSADIMGVKETTTRTLAYRAYRKLGVSNLQAVLRKVRERNLI